MNRLAGEPSAYLRQHAENPVNWQPFDDAAFAEARRRDVPIFLSVGYAACHWCHVMAGESFMDPAIGAFLNENFVSIKVDREERPDVDDAYMAATQALSGEGGWPMSVFLTPDGRAFYAGTYFPPQPVSGRPSFTQLLEAVKEAWHERRDEVETTAADLADALSSPRWQLRALPPLLPDLWAATAATPSTTGWMSALPAAVQALAAAEDTIHGGLGGAPKFPPTPALEFLLRHAATSSDSAHVAAGVAGRAVAAMVNSALFDQVGGGFARYSVSADWSEPHYEKMLYDNAGLLRVLVQWIRLAESLPELPVGALSVNDARRAVHATVQWLRDELRLPAGAYASSLDADTVIEGIHFEGASYQWTMTELRAAAAETLAGGTSDAANELAEHVAAAMNIPATDAPAPFHPGHPPSPAERQAWELILPTLQRRRAERVMPARDNKVVAAWNGLLLVALAEAAMVLDRADYLADAVELAQYLQEVHWEGHLYRVSHEGKARGIQGLLEDYAGCANGFLAVYAATGERRWFEFAGVLVKAMEEDFLLDGVVLNNASTDALTGSRFADPFDNATASGVALMATAFTTWAAYTGSDRHRQLAGNLLAGLEQLARQAPRAAGGLLAAAQGVAAGPLELAIVGAPGAERDALLRLAWASPSPGMAIAVWDGAGDPPSPLLEGRGLAERSTGDSGSPLAYVCKNMVCARPVGTAAGLVELLG